MKVGVLYNGINNAERLKYVLDFISNHPLNNGQITLVPNEKQDTNIFYSGEPPVFGIHVIPQELFFNNLTERRLFANSYRHNGDLLYSVEQKEKKEKSFEQNSLIHFDVLETIFFHISRVEELDVPKKIKNERDQISETALFSIAQSIEKTPVVDKLVLALLSILLPKISSVRTTYRLTHDIDFIRKFKSPLSLLRLAGIGIAKGNFLSTIKQYLDSLFIRSNDPYNNFDFLLQKSTCIDKVIYFLVGGSHTYDNKYSLEDPIFKKAITLAKERGYNIGIHPSYDSWKSSKMMEKEKAHLSKAINQPIDQSRQHYLHFDIKESPSHLLDAGIHEDASLGYTRHIGFRCGTGYPYYLYDFKNEKKSRLKETPLTFMDSAAIHEAKKTKTVLEDLVNGFLLANMENTYISFNFHNSRFDDSEKLGILMKGVYKGVIESIIE